LVEEGLEELEKSFGRMGKERRGVTEKKVQTGKKDKKGNGEDEKEKEKEEEVMREDVDRVVLLLFSCS
jgi:hypothetical protein